MKKLLSLTALSLVLSVSTLARAADPDRGADLFDENCGECHSVASAMHNKKGPSLYHVLGRKVATVPGFTYSPSLAGTGLTWTPQTLDVYLTNPKKVAPDGKMKFDGFNKPADRADVIAFLAQAK